jgi:hypothetical protein
MDRSIHCETCRRPVVRKNNGFIPNAKHLPLRHPRPDRKFRISGATDFFNDKHIKRFMELTSNSCGYHHPSARQTDNDICANGKFQQFSTQQPTGFEAIFKHYAPFHTNKYLGSSYPQVLIV